MANLGGKKILVTGGSRGIGAGIVKYLAHSGAHVAFTYSSKEASALEILKSLNSDNHMILAMNISDEASVQQGVDKVLEKFGTLDGVVNNAGITKDQLLLRMKAEEFDEVINTNLRGTFLVTKAVMKPMMKARRGSVVHVTSVIGQTGNPGQANYAASKAGIEAFSKSVALELASRNIRSNCVAPGFIQSDMTDQLNEAQKKAILDKVPLASIGDVNDVATAVAFLLSDDAKYVTGQTLSVNGGLFMK